MKSIEEKYIISPKKLGWSDFIFLIDSIEAHVNPRQVIRYIGTEPLKRVQSKNKRKRNTTDPTMLFSTPLSARFYFQVKSKREKISIEIDLFFSTYNNVTKLSTVLLNQHELLASSPSVISKIDKILGRLNCSIDWFYHCSIGSVIIMDNLTTTNEKIEQMAANLQKTLGKAVISLSKTVKGNGDIDTVASRFTKQREAINGRLDAEKSSASMALLIAGSAAKSELLKIDPVYRQGKLKKLRTKSLASQAECERYQPVLNLDLDQATEANKETIQQIISFESSGISRSIETANQIYANSLSRQEELIFLFSEKENAISDLVASISRMPKKTSKEKSDVETFERIVSSQKGKLLEMQVIIDDQAFLVARAKKSLAMVKDGKPIFNAMLSTETTEEIPVFNGKLDQTTQDILERLSR